MYADSTLKRYSINRKKHGVEQIICGCFLPELISTLETISKEHNVSVNEIWIDTSCGDDVQIELSFYYDKTDAEIKKEIDEVKSCRARRKEEDLKQLEKLKKKHKQK